MVRTRLGGVVVAVEINGNGEAHAGVVEEQQYIRAESRSGLYGCQIPVDADFHTGDGHDDFITIHWYDEDNVSGLRSCDGEVDDYDSGAYVSSIEIVTDAAVPDDDETTVEFVSTDVKVVAEDGEVSAAVIEEDDFVAYVEEIVDEWPHVVSTRETDWDHDAVIVSGSQHGSMHVGDWMEELVNDSGIEVGYVGVVDEKEDRGQHYDVYDKDWIGRGTLCLKDVRPEC